MTQAKCMLTSDFNCTCWITDIAEHSCSSWASPCLLIKKPDSCFRPCTDYRKVSNITKPASFPLPRMEDCVDQVGSAKFVSKCNLLKGHRQVPLSPRAWEICALITTSGLYFYTVVPICSVKHGNSQ